VFQTLYSTATARRHALGPFADERERYLRHCSDFGATRSTLRQKGDELLWFAHHLGSQAPDGVNLEKGRTSGQRLINIARPWLRFLG
jgi:integrase/recombinase XerD